MKPLEGLRVIDLTQAMAAQAFKRLHGITPFLRIFKISSCVKFND